MGLIALGSVQVEGVRIAATGDARVEFAGTITARDPDQSVGPVIERIDRALREAGEKEVTVDVTALTFVNSSAIRLFVDWAARARGAGPEPAYRIVFRTSPTVTWQRLTLEALLGLAPDVVRVERAS